jgi:hypothetical protein
VALSRAAQGLPPGVADPDVLSKVAEILRRSLEKKGAE